MASGTAYVTDPASTGKLPAVAAEAAPGKATEALLSHLAHLMDQLPDMQAKSERLSNALAAQKIMTLYRAKLTADAALAEADRLVEHAEADLLQATSSLEMRGGGHVDQSDPNDAAPATAAPGCERADEALRLAQERVLHAGLQRGLRIGPANNASADLREALDRSPFDTLEEASANVLADAEIELIKQQIADYQQDYDRTLAACRSAEAAAKTS